MKLPVISNSISFQIRLLFLGLIIIWGAIVFLVIVSIAPLTPIFPRYQVIKIVRLLMPEGWAFFTRDPREPYMNLYRINGSNLTLETLPNSNFYFGGGRDMRFQTSELASLISGISSKWETKKSLAIPSKVFNIANKASYPIICGDYIVTLQDQVPWAWSKSNMTMPYRLIRINVQCVK